MNDNALFLLYVNQKYRQGLAMAEFHLVSSKISFFTDCHHHDLVHALDLVDSHQLIL